MSLISTLEPLLLSVPISLEVALRKAVQGLEDRVVAAETRTVAAETRAVAAEALAVATEDRAVSAEVAVAEAWTGLGVWAAAQGPREAMIEAFAGSAQARTGSAQAVMQARAKAAEDAMGFIWMQLSDWAMNQPNIPGAWASEDPTIIAFRAANSAEDLKEILTANLYHVDNIPAGFRLGGNRGVAPAPSTAPVAPVADAAKKTVTFTNAAPDAAAGATLDFSRSALVSTTEAAGGAAPVGGTSPTEAGSRGPKSRKIN
jgi:hypothetical protein